MKNIDQLNIRIRGKAYLGRKLELGEDVDLRIKGSVVREETEDNQDGSVNICYIIHPMTVEDMHPPPPPTVQRSGPSMTAEEIDEMLGDKEPVDMKDIPF
jgi:hypothetical protein